MGAILLTLEGYLAFLAFSGLPNSCIPTKEGEKTTLSTLNFPSIKALVCV